jgi:hypothetical protein
MNFEQLSNIYLLELKSNGVILDGDIIGVNEGTETSRVKITMLLSDSVIEKYIIIFKLNNEITWRFLNPRDQSDYEYNPDGNGWGYADYSKRIVAPIQLIMDDIGIKMYGWFQVNKFTIVRKLPNVRLYCNSILPEHQAVVDSLQGLIVIENRPVPN